MDANREKNLVRPVFVALTARQTEPRLRIPTVIAVRAPKTRSIIQRIATVCRRIAETGLVRQPAKTGRIVASTVLFQAADPHYLKRNVTSEPMRIWHAGQEVLVSALGLILKAKRSAAIQLI